MTSTGEPFELVTIIPELPVAYSLCSIQSDGTPHKFTKLMSSGQKPRFPLYTLVLLYDDFCCFYCYLLFFLSLRLLVFLLFDLADLSPFFIISSIISVDAGVTDSAEGVFV